MGDRLGDAEKRYYGRIVDLLNDRNEEEEEDSGFTQNVLRQIQADGVSRVFCDKDGSRAVERLLQVCKVDTTFLKELLESVEAEFRRVAEDRCGSHSIEALLKAVGRQVSSVTTSEEENHLETLFLRVFASLKCSLGDLLTHPYASHVVCTAVQVLSGVYMSERLTRSRYSREFRRAKLESEPTPQTGAVVERCVSVPQTFETTLNKLGRSVSKFPNLPALLLDARASPVLQVLLRVLTERLPGRGAKVIQKVVRTIRKGLKDSNVEELSEVLTSSVGSHLVGVLLEVATARLHGSIWGTCFQGKVLNCALHPIANYPLQQFISIAKPAQVRLVLAELLPHLEDVLFAGHCGVVVQMAEACLRSPAQQSEMMKTLLVAFHAQENPNACVPLFLTLTAYEAYLEHEEKTEIDKDITKRSVHVQGSLLVQALFKYKSPRVVVESLLSMETDTIMWLSCDMAGSHAIDTFLTSPTVKSVKKKKFVEKLKPHLVPLCKDKHGSRVMDVVWRFSEVTVKDSLAEELIAHEAEIAEDFYGRIVMRNCNLAHYRRKHRAVWQDKGPTTANTPRELFHDIIDDVPMPAAKKRKLSSRAPAVEDSLSELSTKKKKKAESP